MKFLLYAPTRPIVDFSVILLWAMAVGTIVTASLWQDFGTSENSDERYNELSKVYRILSLLIVVKFIAEVFVYACLIDILLTTII